MDPRTRGRLDRRELLTRGAALAGTIAGGGLLARTAAGHLARAARSVNVADLARSLRGRVVGPGDHGYRAARLVWNARYDDARPSAVVEVADGADVRRVVDLARERELRLVARGGAHSFAGYATGNCLVVDLADSPPAGGARRRARAHRRGRHHPADLPRPVASPQGDLRRHLPDRGDRGRDDGRRPRRALAPARAHLRQPDRGRGRDRRRAPPAGERAATTPTSTGRSGVAAAATSASSPRSPSSSSRWTCRSPRPPTSSPGARRRGALGLAGLAARLAAADLERAELLTQDPARRRHADRRDRGRARGRTGRGRAVVADLLGTIGVAPAAVVSDSGPFIDVEHDFFCKGLRRKECTLAGKSPKGAYPRSAFYSKSDVAIGAVARRGPADPIDWMERRQRDRTLTPRKFSTCPHDRQGPDRGGRRGGELARTGRDRVRPPRQPLRRPVPGALAPQEHPGGRGREPRVGGQLLRRRALLPLRLRLPRTTSTATSAAGSAPTTERTSAASAGSSPATTPTTCSASPSRSRRADGRRAQRRLGTMTASPS